MASKQDLDAFLAQPTLAVVGVSRNPNKFGHMVYKDMKAKGFHVFAINPGIEEVAGDRCYPGLAALPETPGGLVLVVPPKQTEQVVREAAAAGVKMIWLQPGAESVEAIRFCQENGLTVITGECILMFTAPDKFPHNFHRWINKVTGKLPR